MAGIVIFTRYFVIVVVAIESCTAKLYNVLGLGLLSYLSRSNGFYSSFGLLRDICTRSILSWPPSSSKYTGRKKTLIAIVCIVRWSPFNATRHHWSTSAHRSCELPRQYLALQVGNEGGHWTQAVLRSILRLWSCEARDGTVGGTTCNGGVDVSFARMVSCRGCMWLEGPPCSTIVIWGPLTMTLPCGKAVLHANKAWFL